MKSNLVGQYHLIVSLIPPGRLRLSVVGRCLELNAVGLFGELLYCPSHQLTSEANRRWSPRGVAESSRSGVICCRGAWVWILRLTPKSMFTWVCGHADKQPLHRV